MIVSCLNPFSLRDWICCPNPNKGEETTLLSAGRNRGKLHLDDAALQADHGGVGPVVGA